VTKPFHSDGQEMQINVHIMELSKLPKMLLMANIFELVLPLNSSMYYNSRESSLVLTAPVDA
jgi:hypothetical protein